MALETSSSAPAPVRQIATAIAGWVDRLGTVWVEGQLAQISRRPGLQTVFLTLRDPLADISISVTCPRTVIDSLNPPLADGASVVIHAKPNFYANRGTLSLQAREIRMVGLGELLAQLEKRRQLLAAEGLFESHRKRRLPFLPARIGLVTAHHSAAERDVRENVSRRWPGARIRAAYASMQGHKCVAEVVDAIRRLDADESIDVIVVARGGGSVEDLLPFSDENLVRVVSQVGTPVVSAIGHEQDSPLLDLVADVRASTPTHAAALVVPDYDEETAAIAQARHRARAVVAGRLASERDRLTALRSRPALAQPSTLIAGHAHEVHGLRERARRSTAHRIERAKDEVAQHRSRAQALSPLATLERGYAVVQTPDGTPVTSTTQAPPGTQVSLRVADGRLGATIDAIGEDDHDER